MWTLPYRVPIRANMTLRAAQRLQSWISPAAAATLPGAMALMVLDFLSDHGGHIMVSRSTLTGGSQRQKMMQSISICYIYSAVYNQGAASSQPRAVNLLGGE